MNSMEIRPVDVSRACGHIECLQPPRNPERIWSWKEQMEARSCGRCRPQALADARALAETERKKVAIAEFRAKYASLPRMTKAEAKVRGLVAETDLFVSEAVRPGSEPVGRLRSWTLVWRRTDISHPQSATAWGCTGRKPTHRIRDGERPVRFSGAPLIGSWAVYGDWQVEPLPNP